jgi:dTDP-4-amino-4,6-dideoxygalactose transaminase
MIPITRPCVGVEEADAARDVVLSGWLTQGDRVAEFERAVASRAGTHSAVAVSSCTTALHLALVALGVGPGDEVICPSMSFIATANAIRHAGATPVFADIDPLTWNLDPRAAEAAITPRTRALLVVHQIGMPADLDQFLAVGVRHGIPVVEDAACAIGSRYKGRPIGGDGVMACFSFHPRKVVTTGEGGAVTTNDPHLAGQVRLLRQHGMSVPDTVRHASTRVIFEEYVCVGYNYRMTDLQAAVGLEQLKKLDGIVARRRELAFRYTEALADHPWLRPPLVPEYAEPNFQSYAVQLTPKAPMSRNEVMQRLLGRGIATRRGIMLSHREPPYARDRHADLRHSEAASLNSLLLPLYPQMTAREQGHVVEALFALVGGGGLVR